MYKTCDESGRIRSKHAQDARPQSPEKHEKQTDSGAGNSCYVFPLFVDSASFPGTTANKMIHRFLPLVAVFLLAMPSTGELEVIVKFDNTTSEISLSLSSITAIDSIGNGSICKWEGYPCYIECEFITYFENTTGNAEVETGKGKSNAINITVGASGCEITKCFPDEFKDLLKRTLLHEDQAITELKKLLNMKRMCKNLFNRDKIKRFYIGIEKILIKNAMKIPFNGQKKIYNLGDLALKLVQINSSIPDPTEDYVKIDAPLLNHEDMSCTPQTRIPTKIFQKIPVEQKVAVVTYKTPDQFLFHEESPQSMLIRVELLVEEDPAEKMELPLLMKFFVCNSKINPEVYALECQFYDERAGENATWSNQGCITNRTERGVQCSCDHMTPFAVLLVPANKIDSKTWEIQSIISYIGSGLSAFFTAVAILTYVILRSPSQDHSGFIHVSLSGALFLLNVSLLSNELLANLHIKPLCLSISILMHYTLLCSFTWMAIEALHLYLLIIRVFNTYIRFYITKLAIVGWGVPAVVIGVAIAVGTKPNFFYGEETKVVGNSTRVFCWITNRYYFYGLNITYFALIFLFNNGILLTVSTRIWQMKRFGKKTGMVIPWRQTCTVLGLTCLLGSTWGLAFLSYGALSIPMQVLFCICNSLQGFCFFLWICCTSRKAKRETSTATLQT
ncbi:hypothetical protein GJAV_G00245500 [Gymnothorax javanicus]|nr:hypothetical protein GJAV_G00245500 [Gymnothorax javanicus]